MRRFSALFLVCHCLLSCGGDSGPAAADRTAWNKWATDFVYSVCAHDDACGTPTGASCIETGSAAAEKASCDAAVSFYVSNKAALEACTNPYPSTCSVNADQACPLMKDHPFESLCP